MRALAVATLLASLLPARADCVAEQGARRAGDYLRQCRLVAARKDCAAAVTCEGLRRATERGCEALGPDAPDFCGLYAQEGDTDADPDMEE